MTSILPGSAIAEQSLSALCRAVGNGHMAGETDISSSGGLAAQEAAHAWDPTATRAEGCAGWERRDEAVAQGRHRHHRGWAGGTGISPVRGFPLAVLSLPAHGFAAWSCSCQRLFTCSFIFSMPVLPNPFPASVRSAEPCRILTTAGHCGKVMLVCPHLREEGGTC